VINVAGGLAGAALGLGVAVMAAGWSRPDPDLPTTLARIDGRTPHPTTPDTSGAGPGPEEGGTSERAAARMARAAAAWLAATRTDLADHPAVAALRLRRLTKDLDLLGETLELLLVRKAGYALLGLVFPTVFTTALALTGTRLPWTLPALASLVLAAVLFMVPDLDVRSRAGQAREQLRRAVCLYIELVALERAADAGPIEAVERAARLGQAPAFTRIRAALTQARLDGDPPWHGLHTLAEATGVVELGDLADIMSTSGRQGTAVYTSLRARATSLRTALTSQDAAAANAASERMVIPVAFLGLVFTALLAYPAIFRIAFTHP
jgi:Type II secretion system (T2SS), protein F